MASDVKRRSPSGLSPSAQPFVLGSRHGSGLSQYPSLDNWQPGEVGLAATTSSSSTGSLLGRHRSSPLVGFQGDIFTALTGGGDGALSAAGNRGNNSLKIDAESYYPQYTSGVFQVSADFDGLVNDSEKEFDETLMPMNSYIQLGQKMNVVGDGVNKGKSVDHPNRILQPLTHGNGSVSVTCGGSSSAQGMHPCREPTVSLDTNCIGTLGDNKIISNGTKQIDTGCIFLPGSESMGTSSGISCSSDMHLTAISANPQTEATYQVSPTIWNYSDLNSASYERSFSQQPSSYVSQMNLSPSSQSNVLQSLVFEPSGAANNNDLFSSCPVKIKAPPITSHKSKDERNGKSINDDASASLFMTKSEVQISCPSVLHDSTLKLPVAKDGEPVDNSCKTFDENDSDLDSPCWKGRMADNHCTSKDSGLVDSSNLKSGQEEACSSLNPLAPQFFPSYIKPTGINFNSGSDDDSCVSSQKTVSSALNVPSGDQVLVKPAESCSLKLNNFVDTHVQPRQEAVLRNSNDSSVLCLSDLGQPLIGECCLTANAQPLADRNLGTSVKGFEDGVHSDSTVDALDHSDWGKLLVELNGCDSQQLTVPSKSRNRSLHTSDTKPLTVPNSLISVKEIMDAACNDSSVSAVNDSDWSDMLGPVNHYDKKQHAVPNDSINSSMLSSSYTVESLLGLDIQTSNSQLLTGPDVGGSEKGSKDVGHEDSSVDILESINLGNVLGPKNQYDSRKHTELNNSSNSSLLSLAHLVQPLAEEDYLTFNAEPLAGPNLGVLVKGIRRTADSDSTIITLNSSELCNMQGHVYQCDPKQNVILDNFSDQSMAHTSDLIQPLLGEDYLVSNGQPPLRPNVGSSVKAIGRPSQADSAIAVLNSSKSMHQDSKQHAVLDDAQNSSMLGLSEMLEPLLGEDSIKFSTRPLTKPNAGSSLKGTTDAADNESTNVSQLASSSSFRVCIPSESKETPGNESKETPGNATKSLGMPRLDVETVVNTMNKLSELLMQNCSIDSDCLNEHEHEKIKNIINNLSICIQNRVGNRTQMPELSLTGDSYRSMKSGDLHQYSSVESNRTGTKANMRPPELLYQNEYQQQGLSASVIASVLCSIPTTKDGVMGRREFVSGC